MRSGKNGQADNLDIFLQRGIDDHFRGLPETGIDNFHTRIPQSARDYLRAPVVSVEAGFGDQHPDSMIHKRLRLRLRYAPVAYLASAVHPRLEDITEGGDRQLACSHGPPILPRRDSQNPLERPVEGSIRFVTDRLSHIRQLPVALAQ